MVEEKITTASIQENGESAYSVSIDVSGFTLKGDEPVSFGGGGLGPAPYDLLTAALGECTAMTIRWFAIQKEWPLEKVEVRLSHKKVNKQDFFTKHISLYGSALTEEQKTKLIEIAAKCPIQRTLEGTPHIITEDA